MSYVNGRQPKDDEDSILGRDQPQEPPPSLLTVENFNSREEPNPKLKWKMQNWYAHEHDDVSHIRANSTK